MDEPGKTILLADDDDSVRRIAARMLRSWGYRVIEAVHGLDALQQAARHSGPIHLLITDDLMPHVNGPDLAQVLCCERPELRVLFTFGYLEASTVGGGLRRRGGFLDKPYGPAALRRRVWELVADHSEASAVDVV
jgi:two-component system, cell cycle sensor histidine kinase and response regulator CckA